MYPKHAAFLFFIFWAAFFFLSSSLNATLFQLSNQRPEEKFFLPNSLFLPAVTMFPKWFPFVSCSNAPSVQRMYARD